METTITDDRQQPDGGGDLEKVQLEKEKLQEEIRRIKEEGSWGNRAARYLPAMTALIAAAAFCFGVYQFKMQQKESLDRQDAEMKKANATTEQEFKKPFWEKQLQLYFDASEAASTIATSSDAAKRKAAEERFWQLYWGSLAVVEDAGVDVESDNAAKVEAAMVKFGNCLDGTEQCDDGERKMRSLVLAHTLRESMGKSWNVHMADLRGKYNKIHGGD